MRRFFVFFFIPLLLLVFACSGDFDTRTKPHYHTGKPYTRWWWFAGIPQKKDIAHQLDWLKDQNFGGVEIAFIYPYGRDPEAKRIAWLSNEWTGLVTFAKEYAGKIGLGCDFTFGTLWPFGGTFVSDRDRTKIFGDTSFRQPLRLSWTHPDTGNVLDHLSKPAFHRYAEIMGKALEPALGDGKSALFCDSWEVETKNIWTDNFHIWFFRKNGYDIRTCMDSIYMRGFEDELYDYMKLVSELVIDNFYRPFTNKAHRLGAFSRAQCAGSPTDLLKAYSMIDIPETEAMLYEPAFSNIVASAAALSSKKIISSETFTCLYGFPRDHILEEKVSDLKLVCDALFANGTNHIIWHGMPYNPAGSDSMMFYATVHLGTKGALTAHLKGFNGYMENVSNWMRRGKPYAQAAVYLPLEDSWMAGEYPPEKQMKWSWGQYEMRYIYFPEELEGFSLQWINNYFLEKAELRNEKLCVGDLEFSFLYIDVEHLDSGSLNTILALAEKGFPVCMKQAPKQPGRKKDKDYNLKLSKLMSFKNVGSSMQDICRIRPIIEGENLPDYYCRSEGGQLIVFFAHPLAKDLTFPLEYGHSETKDTLHRNVTINWLGKSHELILEFAPYQSLILTVDGENLQFVDISYYPSEG